MAEKTYKIGEAAELLKLKTYVLRFWEMEFAQLAPLRTQTGQRLYSEKDLAVLQRIRHLLHERGLTIEGARKQLAEEERRAAGKTKQAAQENSLFDACGLEAPAKKANADTPDTPLPAEAPPKTVEKTATANAQAEPKPGSAAFSRAASKKAAKKKSVRARAVLASGTAPDTPDTPEAGGADAAAVVHAPAGPVTSVTSSASATSVAPAAPVAAGAASTAAPEKSLPGTSCGVPAADAQGAGVSSVAARQGRRRIAIASLRAAQQAAQQAAEEAAQLTTQGAAQTAGHARSAAASAASPGHAANTAGVPAEPPAQDAIAAPAIDAIATPTATSGAALNKFITEFIDELEALRGLLLAPQAHSEKKSPDMP